MRKLAAFLLVAMAATAAHAQAPAQDPFIESHASLVSAADRAVSEIERMTAAAPIAEGRTAIAPRDFVQQFAQQYWSGQDRGLRQAIERVERLRAIAEPILAEEGVPREIAAVMLVESGGRKDALSPKGARGIWQFMPETARAYGLRVGEQSDERLDVVKSTRAAARLLRDLHQRFAEWPLALAAYNAGPEAVESAVRRTGSRDFTVLSTLRTLPAETRNYVPAVFAATSLFGGNLTQLAPVASRHGRILYANSSSKN